MEIAPLTPDHYDAAVALWREAGLARPWNDPVDDLQRAAEQPSSTVLAGIERDQLLATAMVGHDGHRGWVYYVAVAPAARGRGHGRAIMRACEQWLVQRGVPKLNLMVRGDKHGRDRLLCRARLQAGRCRRAGQAPGRERPVSPVLDPAPTPRIPIVGAPMAGGPSTASLAAAISGGGASASWPPATGPSTPSPPRSTRSVERTSEPFGVDPVLAARGAGAGVRDRRLRPRAGRRRRALRRGAGHARLRR